MINKKEIYYNVISHISKYKNQVEFLKSGKLTICLIEYRILLEIEYVLNALLHVYNSNEIGLTIICGNNNIGYIQNKFKGWKNLNIINTGHDNLNRRTYSSLLKMPSFWEYFKAFSYVLIYQTDALIFRKIDDNYFKYDYIGARWNNIDNWLGNYKPKFNGGNGGFSLRHVKSMINVCEIHRNLKHEEINGSNEDGFFCSSDILKFPDEINTHIKFAVEEIYYDKPVGCHAIYKYLSNDNFFKLINHIKSVFNITESFPKENILMFKLFGGQNGVGFYNQIFSLELAIYMSNFFKRKLFLIIDNPLAAKGVCSWDYGTIFDYINDIGYLLPYGYDIYIKKKINIFSNIYEIELNKHMSSCIYVDKDYRKDIYKEDVTKFANGRTDISIQLDELFDYKKKYIYFKKSNASRFFYNFYTSLENYKLMNKIAKHFIKMNNCIMNSVNAIKLPRDFISIHIRFGDIGKSDEFINKDNDIIYNNIANWLSKNKNMRPILIMTDVINHIVIKKIRILYSDVILTNNLYNKDNMKKYYRNPSVANFLIDKLICEKASCFLGSRTSTVSVHINYSNYLQNKPYTHYINYFNNNFDSDKLEYKTIHDNEKWTWNKYEFDKGHPTSWVLFFNDNVHRDITYG